MVAVLHPTTHDDAINMADSWPYTAADYLEQARRKEAFADWCMEQVRNGYSTHDLLAQEARIEAKALRKLAERRYGAAHGRQYQTGK